MSSDAGTQGDDTAATEPPADGGTDGGQSQADANDETVFSTRVLALLAVIGLVCVAGAFLVGLTDLTNTYSHTLTADSEFPADETVGYDGLSPAGQDAFQAAFDSGETAWTAEPAPDFSYPEEEGDWVTRVEYQGETYRLSTARQIRGVTVSVTGIRLSLAAAGVLLLLAGVAPLAHGRVRDRTLTNRERETVTEWLPAWAFVVAVPGVMALVLAVLSLSETVSGSMDLFFFSSAVIGVAISAAGTVLFFKRITVSARLFFYSTLLVHLLWVFALLTVLSPSASTIIGAVFLLTFVVLYSLLGQLIGWNVWYRLLDSSE